MQPISNLFNEIVGTTKAQSKRAELVGFFTDEINKERPCTYKVNGKKVTKGKVTARAVAIKLGHMKDLEHLKWFLSECHDYRNRNGSFTKRFFGGVKISTV